MTGDELAALLEKDEVALLDVRSHEEYSGEAGYPCDPYQGHIPGAVHLDLNEIYAAGDRLTEVLASRGLSLGMKLENWPPAGLDRP